MANDVFANGREISCKAGSGKSIAAFPDVCFTPPENPATPPGTPIPYPNTGMASDTTSGSKKVKISNKEVMLKNKSHFKKSVGDEAGCAAKKGVVTSTNRGKVYFNAWSMDVKIEGKNAVRHLDLTTHNHRSFPGNSPTWPYVDEMAVKGKDHPCHDDFKRERADCEGMETEEQICADTEDAQKCRDAQKCMCVPFRPYKESRKYGRVRDTSPCCSSDTSASAQPHHLIEDNWIKGRDEFSWYKSTRGADAPDDLLEEIQPGSEAWKAGQRTDYDAPCICAEGNKWEKEHGWFHCQQASHVKKFLPGGERESDPWNYGEAKTASLQTHRWIAQSCGVKCNEECMRRQLDNFYGKDDDERELNCDVYPVNQNPEKGVTGEFMDASVSPKPLTHQPLKSLGDG